jgi:putative heme-binding domain-containing protein
VALSARIKELLTSKNSPVAVAACEAAGKLQATGCADALAAVVNDKKVAAKVRFSALDALSVMNAPVLDSVLPGALTANDSAVRIVAGAILAKRDPIAAAKQLVAAWATSDATAKKGLADTLAGIQTPEVDRFFANAVDTLSAEPKEAHLEILEGAAKHPTAEVNAALARYEASLPADDIVAKFAPVMFGGSRGSGEKLFKEHPVTACMRCHKIGEAGGDAGPVLEAFGKTHDRNYIVESIVNVNAKVAPGFQMVMLTLKDGGFKAGLLKSEDAQQLTLQMPPAPPETVPLKSIAKRDNAPSGMIPNIPDLISRRELRDIVEFVSSLK